MSAATAVRERPILLADRLVRATLDDTKTQTRRPVKGHALNWLESGFAPSFVALPENYLSPFGYAGDRLWVREAFALAEDENEKRPTYRNRWVEAYRADGETGYRWRPSIHMPRWASRITLEITDVRVERVQEISEDDVLAEGVRVPVSESGTPLLRLTGKPAPCEYPPLNHRDTIATATAADWLRAHFACEWDEHYAGGPYAWAANPFVWVIGYRRIEL